MNTLKIRFEQMFLLVRSQQYPVVLFPSGTPTTFPHELYVIGTPKPLLVQGADLSIVQVQGNGEKTPFADPKTTQSEWPNSGWVLDLNKLADARVPGQTDPKIRSNVYSRTVTQNCPPILNARFYMPHGNYEWKWNLSKFGDARWLVGPASGGSHNQWLTDVMEFECEIFGASYYLKADVAGEDPQYFELKPDKKGDIELVIHNRDVTDDSGESNPGVVKFLKDFKLLYDLAEDLGKAEYPEYFTMLPSSRPSGPPPDRKVTKPLCVGARCASVTGLNVILTTTNPEFPICGGGSGEPGP